MHVLYKRIGQNYDYKFKSNASFYVVCSVGSFVLLFRDWFCYFVLF